MGAPGMRRLMALYIQMRAYDPETRAYQHVKGSGLRISGYTPQQAADIIVRAFAAEGATIERKEGAQPDETGTTPDVSPQRHVQRKAEKERPG